MKKIFHIGISDNFNRSGTGSTVKEFRLFNDKYFRIVQMNYYEMKVIELRHECFEIYVPNEFVENKLQTRKFVFNENFVKNVISFLSKEDFFKLINCLMEWSFEEGKESKRKEIGSFFAEIMGIEPYSYSNSNILQ